MSEAAYLVCDDCGTSLWMGKPIRDEGGETGYFHIGSEQAPPNSARSDLTRALWKFVAEHGRHRIRVTSDYDDHFDVVAAYREIGGDTTDDISFEDYLRDWPG